METPIVEPAVEEPIKAVEQMDTERACSYADYTKKDLTTYTFEFYIQSSKFDEAILPEVIEGTKFECCSFLKSDLRDRRFIKCEFIDCVFDDADMRSISMSSCVLTRCELVKTDLRDAILKDTTFIEPVYKYTDFRNCRFSSISFTEEEAKLCDLRDIYVA